MEEYLTEEQEYKGCKVKIYQDINYSDNPFEQDEGLGNFYHWKDCGKEQFEKYCELLGYDIDTREKIRKDYEHAVRIDKYEHSCIYYSIEGEGTQCRWDTSHTWAVWYPTECLFEDLKRFKSKKAQRKRAIELAKQACEVFNDWINGNIYGYIVENKEGENIDSCWGFFGDYRKGGMIEEAKGHIDYYIEEERKNKQQKVKALVKNRVSLTKREVIIKR